MDLSRSAATRANERDGRRAVRPTRRRDRCHLDRRGIRASARQQPKPNRVRLRHPRSRRSRAREEHTNQRLSRVPRDVAHPPRTIPNFSTRDTIGMLNLLDASESPRAQGLILIVGCSASDPQLGAYVFEHEELRRNHVTISVYEPCPVPVPAPVSRDVGLALSGGGSRAVAFHLGCLRALHDRSVLNRIRVISGVSGGALMTGLWAYGPEQFENFDEAVRELLHSGLHRRILRRALMSRRIPQALASSILVAGAGAGGRVTRRSSDVARWRSRTDAFADVLTDIFERRAHARQPPHGWARRGDQCLRPTDRSRVPLRVARKRQLDPRPRTRQRCRPRDRRRGVRCLPTPCCRRSIAPGCWKSSTAPSARKRVTLTDGGVFDNLGTSCSRPGRSTQHSYNVFGVDYVIACDAGRGQLAEKTPGHLLSRVSRSFEASFRKLQELRARCTSHPRRARRTEGVRDALPRPTGQRPPVAAT